MHASDDGPQLDAIECPRCYILFDLVHRVRTPYLVCPRCQLLRIISM